MPFVVTLNCSTSLRLLIKHGARVNKVSYICTPYRDNIVLNVACNQQLADAVALLHQYGADMNVRNGEATARIAIREAVRREALGQPLCEDYINMAQSREDYLKFEQECREEVKRMKSEGIETNDSAVSLFKMLFMNEEELARIARNQNIVAGFEEINCLVSFNIYAD